MRIESLRNKKTTKGLIADARREMRACDSEPRSDSLSLLRDFASSL